MDASYHPVRFHHLLTASVWGAMVQTTSGGGTIKELTREEGWGLLDKQARRYLDMSAEEFIEAWEAGQFDADPDRPEVMHVAMLLPFVRNGRSDSQRSRR